MMWSPGLRTSRDLERDRDLEREGVEFSLLSLLEGLLPSGELCLFCNTVVATRSNQANAVEGAAKQTGWQSVVGDAVAQPRASNTASLTNAKRTSNLLS